MTDLVKNLGDEDRYAIADRILAGLIDYEFVSRMEFRNLTLDVKALRAMVGNLFDRVNRMSEDRE